jgi:hypothetical protein
VAGLVACKTCLLLDQHNPGARITPQDLARSGKTDDAATDDAM